MNKTKEQEDFILAEARTILRSRMRKPGGVIQDIGAVQQYLQTEYATLQNEQFGCMFLDNSYGLINHKKMFRGTINHCATYPREIAREALLQNASLVIVIHNHPAHQPIASAEDIASTLELKRILLAVGIVLFDHIIVAGTNLYSMRGAGDF